MVRSQHGQLRPKTTWNGPDCVTTSCNEPSLSGRVQLSQTIGGKEEVRKGFCSFSFAVERVESKEVFKHLRFNLPTHPDNHMSPLVLNCFLSLLLPHIKSGG